MQLEQARTSPPRAKPDDPKPSNYIRHSDAPLVSMSAATSSALLPPFDSDYVYGLMSPSPPPEGYSPAMASSVFSNNYTYHRDSMSSEMSAHSCPELVYSPTSDPYDSSHSDVIRPAFDFEGAVDYSDYIADPTVVDEAINADVEEHKPNLSHSTPMPLQSRQVWEPQIYSPSCSSVSNTPSCSSGSEYGLDYDEEQGSVGSRGRSPYAGSVGPMGTKSGYPASPLGRGKPYPLSGPGDYFTRRSSSSSAGAGLHNTLANLGVASPGLEGTYHATQPSVDPSRLEIHASSAPALTWDFDTFKRGGPIIGEKQQTVRSPQHPFRTPPVQQGFFPEQTMSAPGFATHLFGAPVATPFNSPVASRNAQAVPRSAPLARCTRQKRSKQSMDPGAGDESDGEPNQEDPKDSDYEDEAASPDGEHKSGTKRSRQGTVKASHVYNMPAAASVSLPNISDFDRNLVTSQGTLRGMRMPINGINPSTTGAFMALDDVTSYMHMPTKRSRGRRPVAETDLGLNSTVDPNHSPTSASIEFSGTTRLGKPKKIFMCQVPGCGKCFKRSEHLKRHVRSIHTDEKPFLCPEPGCTMQFSRVDNLNQHFRLHGGGRRSAEGNSNPRKARRKKQEDADDSDEYKP